MRRHPARDPTPPPSPNQVAAKSPPLADSLGDPIEPFLCSGGMGYFFNNFPGGTNVVEFGTQLLCSLYVPQGRTAFLKQLRVAPFCPPQFAAPWVTSGAANGTATWEWFGGPGNGVGGTRAAPQNGVWTTPFAWENLFDANAEVPEIPTAWAWSLRLVQGDVVPKKQAAFNPADRQSWQFALDIPVPSEAYPGGLPGTSPGPNFNQQRMQVLQADQLTLHLPIPQNTTLCLFVQWTQQAQPLYAFGETGAIEYGAEEYPLLPSFGQMLGYVQNFNAPPLDERALNAAARNMRGGWGG